MSRSLRLARPVTPPPLRDLSACTCYANAPELRAKWSQAVEWLRSRDGGSKWILDQQVVTRRT